MALPVWAGAKAAAEATAEAKMTDFMVDCIDDKNFMSIGMLELEKIFEGAKFYWDAPQLSYLAVLL